MDYGRIAVTVIFIGIVTGTLAIPNPFVDVAHPPQDLIRISKKETQFKYLYLAKDGTLVPHKAAGRLEIAATVAITDQEHRVGAFIVARMIKNMKIEVFNKLARRASVGLFTAADKTTIFPEYQQHADRPECAGTCAGACSDTCNEDGLKYDSLVGLGGIRTTCLNDNFMCSPADPYSKRYSILVHEFGHTTLQFGLPGVSDYYARVSAAYKKARENAIWDLNSHAMSDESEYFAEATGVFFNAHRLPDSSGGMNSCGRPVGFCASESEARDWLKRKDPRLFHALSITFTNFQPTRPGGLAVCVA